MHLANDETALLEHALAVERTRLVGLCAHLTGNPSVAEDLAQETLAEAWRHIDKLHDPSGLSSWLSAIARNVCLRWRSQQSRERVHDIRVVAELDGLHGLGQFDEVDIDVELDRHELADLLDRALALLPPETRAALIERYVEGSPHAEIAERLGITESAVKMRIQRGKLILHRALTTEFRHDALAFGLITTERQSWQETRIWCPVCGQARLVAQFDRERGDFLLRCPICYPAFNLHITRTYREPDVFHGIKGYRAALNRVTASGQRYYGNALATNTTTCYRCGAPATVSRQLPAELRSRPRERLGVCVRCTACSTSVHISLGGLVAGIPVVRRFWREHPRMRTIPERELEVDGRSAVVTQLESVNQNAKLAVVVATDSFDVLRIHRQ